MNFAPSWMKKTVETNTSAQLGLRKRLCSKVLTALGNLIVVGSTLLSLSFDLQAAFVRHVDLAIEFPTEFPHLSRVSFYPRSLRLEYVRRGGFNL